MIAILAVATGLASFLLALRPSLLVPAVVAFLVAFLVVLAAWPEVNALAAIGPHPDGGGRFYGVTNEVETLLLAPSLAAAASAGIIGATAIGLLLLVLVGWSRAGADGGGLLVVTAAFAVLLARLTRVRLTPARLVLGVAGVLAVGLAIVGLDALLGGSSHVTDAVGGGPGTLLDDLDRRLRISWAGATSAGHTAFLCLLSLGGLAWLGIRGRKQPAIAAMLVAIGVSLLVNDTPVDVLGYGALGCLALTAWAETRSRDPLRLSASALRLRAAFQSHKSTPRIDRQVEPHDPGPPGREANRAVVAARKAASARRPVGRPVRCDAVAAGTRDRDSDPVLPEQEHFGAARSGHYGRGEGTA